MAADLPLSGRMQERATLARLVASPKAELLALYGRRRVGKTFLVRRFFRDAPVVLFEMVGRFGASVGQHLQIFAESLSRAFHDGAPLLPPATWHDAFRALEAALEARRSKGKKIVLFFDELPWIATHRSGVLAELEQLTCSLVQRRGVGGELGDGARPSELADGVPVVGPVHSGAVLAAGEGDADELVEHRRLGREREVEGPLGDAGLGRDPLHGGGCVPLVDEEASSRVPQPGPGLARGLGPHGGVVRPLARRRHIRIVAHERIQHNTTEKVTSWLRRWQASTT